jgi:hypothetical protein
VPKKTKKEKIIAELRRKLDRIEVRSGKIDLEVRNLDKLEDKSTPLISKNQDVQFQVPTSNLQLPTSYIINDLQKTFFLAGLAISLELVIYWLSELGGSKLLQFLPIK